MDSLKHFFYGLVSRSSSGLAKNPIFCLILEKADMQLRNPLWENSHRVQLAVYLATHLEYFVSIYFDKGKMGNKYFALSCKFSTPVILFNVKLSWQAAQCACTNWSGTKFKINFAEV